jgi:hypothetical protein
MPRLLPGSDVNGGLVARSSTVLVALLLPLASAGCGAKTPAPAAPAAAAPAPPPPPPGHAAAAPNAPPGGAMDGAPAARSRSILGRTTQEVRDAPTEEAAGAQRIEKPEITGQDYITVTGQAYSVILGRSAILSIQHAVDLFNAENGRYPKDYDEFKREIIAKNRIQLPLLPAHQKYGYDAQEHKLVILEYRKQ